MASTLKHLRSSTADKRPTGSGLSDGQIAINTASGTPGLFVKDNAGDVVKIGPAHVGTVAPNAVPAGSTGNSKGEMWVDENLTTRGLKYYDGTNFVNLTPSGTSTTIGLVQLATNAETQAGTVSTKAVTPSGLQSKVSDSISTTSSTVLASATAVKTAYDLANAALPKGGGTVSGVLEIGSTGTFQFDGSSADANKTVLAVVNPTANRTITLPNVTGTVVTTGDNGTVTSTMIADGTIANVDINASAAIVDTKLATISTAGKVSNSATTATNANTASAIVARDGSGNFSAGTISATFIGNLTGTASAIADNTVTSAKIVDGAIVNADINASAAIGLAKLATGALPTAITVASANIVDGTIVNADVNASAAIAGTKISPNFGSQNVLTTGTATAASLNPTGSTVPTNGLYLPAANSVAISTNGTQRLTVDTAATTSTLPVVHPLGAVGTPSITFTGDLNTGIYSPAADTIAFVEGGAEAMRIDSSGRLGLGTTSPVNLLHVQGDATFDINAGGQFAIRGSTNTSNRLNFGFETTNNYAWIQSITTGTAARPIALNPSGGSVGIGTGATAPGGTLDIKAPSATAPLIVQGPSSEFARIDSSGRLLVGTSTSLDLGSQTQIAGTGANFEVFRFNTGATVVGGSVDLARSGSGTVGTLAAVATNQGLGVVRFRGAGNASTWITGAQIEGVVDAGTVSSTSMPGRLVFSTTADGASSPTEAMRIDSSKKVWVGDSFSFAGSFVSLSRLKTYANSASNTGSVAIECAANSADTRHHITFTNSNGAVGSISTNASATAYNTSSDYRLKENVVLLTGAIDRLRQIPVHRFNFIADPDTVVDGFIAHEAQEIVPECVTGTKDEVDADGNPVYQGIDQSKLVPLLTAALQEALQKIEDLEGRLDAAGI